MVLTYSREELLHYCKNFVIPKSKSIHEWKEGESFCISFLNPKEEYILFVGKYLINLLKIECEESELLKYSYALLTFFMCENLLDYLIVDRERIQDTYYLFYRYSVKKRDYHELLDDNEKCALVNNIRDIFIRCGHLKSDTKVFKSGSCNDSYIIWNDNIACINCYDCRRCEYCIDCTNCYKCEHCVSCERSRTCIYSENLAKCVYCKYSKQCASCKTCNYCNQCNYCKFCTQCNNCNDCRSCKHCCECNDCTYLKKGNNFNGIHNDKPVKGKEWDTVKDITDIIKDSNYSLPIVKVIDINDEGWRLECTSQEYIIIYDPCGTIRFKGRLTCKNPCKLSIDNMYLCCGSIYNDHGVLTDVLYIGRTKKKDQSKCLSIKDFCNGKSLCEKLVKKYDLMGNVVYSTI